MPHFLHRLQQSCSLLACPTCGTMRRWSKSSVLALSRYMMAPLTSWFKLWISCISDTRMRCGAPPHTSWKGLQRLIWYYISAKLIEKLSCSKQSKYGMHETPLCSATYEALQPTIIAFWFIPYELHHEWLWLFASQPYWQRILFWWTTSLNHDVSTHALKSLSVRRIH